MKKRFERNINSLGDIFKFIELFITRNNIKESVSFNIKVVVEELFTNQIRHAVGKGEFIDIHLKIEKRKVFIELDDFNVEPFNPGERKKTNFELPLSRREIGGLGLHFVLNLTEDLEFIYKNSDMKVTAVIDSEGLNVQH
jgi:anti-sigma regulatory factor (Ser/Thr protein kinase)